MKNHKATYAEFQFGAVQKCANLLGLEKFCKRSTHSSKNCFDTSEIEPCEVCPLSVYGSLRFLLLQILQVQSPRLRVPERRRHPRGRMAGLLSFWRSWSRRRRGSCAQGSGDLARSVWPHLLMSLVFLSTSRILHS